MPSSGEAIEFQGPTAHSNADGAVSPRYEGTGGEL